MNIRQILTSKPHNIHYLNRYIKLIDNYITAQANIGEKHHICPKSNDLFPEFKSFKINAWNMVKLPHRVHFIAHWMLHKAYGGKQTFAFIAMCNQLSPTKVRIKRIAPNSRWYESARVDANILIAKNNSKPNVKLSKRTVGTVMCREPSGNVIRVTQEVFDNDVTLVGVNKGNYSVGKHMKDEKHKAATSTRMVGRVHLFNEITNDKKFVKKEDINHYMTLGYILSSGPAYDRNNYQKTCEHCHKVMDSSNLGKWHGDRCKLSPKNINPLFV